MSHSNTMLTYLAQERFAAVMAEAVRLYGELPCCPLEMNLRGQCAGQYRWDRRGHVVRVNLEAMRLDLQHVLSETIPHEVAHFVAHVKGLGKGHNAGWVKVAKSLGCAGRRCHNITLVSAGGARVKLASGKVIAIARKHVEALEAGLTLRTICGETIERSQIQD